MCNRYLLEMRIVYYLAGLWYPSTTTIDLVGGTCFGKTAVTIQKIFDYLWHLSVNNEKLMVLVAGQH